MTERLPSPVRPPDIRSREGAVKAVVAVPARNERAHLGPCLRALAAQTGLMPDSLGVVLFLNNCTDGSADAVRALLPSLPWPVRVVECIHPRATAGWARRVAMNAAADWLAAAGEADGVILTTDADSRVGPDWVQRNLAYIGAGHDAVAGRFVLDDGDIEALPAGLRARGRLEAAYEARLTEIGARLDPEPGNPWPCHWTTSGATLAVRRKSYLAAGGMPALSCGEDRAFVEALRASGARVRQATDIVVVTSGRLEGRAIGGAADTMRRRCAALDSPCDRRLESAPRALMRVLLRRRLRSLYGRGGLKALYAHAGRLGLPAAARTRLTAAWTFEQAYGVIEMSSPRLAFRPLRPSQLRVHIRLADLILRLLSLRDRQRPAERRADSPACASETAAVQPQPSSG